MRFRKLFLIAAAGLLSAGFAYLGTGLHPMWWALWLAPVPVIASATRLHASVAFFLGAIVWLIGEMNQWNYVADAIELPWHIIVLYFVVPAVVFGFGVLFVRGFIRHGSLFLASVAFPVYWVAYEYVTATVSPHSTWGNLAYTQMNCLPVIQIAAIAGPWGISFIVFLFAGAGGVLLSGTGRRRQRSALAITVGLVVCGILVFGKWRLQSNPAAQPVAVTLIAKDVPMNVYLGSEEQALEVLRQYADEIRRVTPAGTQAVVLPEKIGRIGESA
jgi:apolipoprotein N-acyltransferase